MTRHATQDRSSTAPIDPALPPGQHRVDGFPRFGTHLHLPAPPVPVRPQLSVEGALTRAFTIPLADLHDLPRREMTADFHCVAGWTATGLRWEGVPFADFYRLLIEPAVPEGTVVSHLVFTGLDDYRAVATLEDALAPSVLLAQNLDGQPLDSDHGAPLRLVSPDQYGFVSTKHLCRIELLTAEPHENYGSASALGRLLMLRPLFDRHPRSRVWHEERNGSLPSWFVRPIYRLFTPPFAALSALGSHREDGRRDRRPGGPD